MKIRRYSAVAALAAAGALALSACSNSPTNSSSTDTGSAPATTGGTVTVAETNQFSSLNTNTANGNSDINGKVQYATSAHFYYVDADLKVQHDDSVGTFEKTSDNPLTVKYTINDGAKWSDGTPITADDLVFTWAAQSGWYNTKDTTYFDFAGSTTGLNATNFPEVSSDDKTMTLTYTKPFADWEIGIDLDKPAHIIAKNAGLADAPALTALFKSLPKGDPTKSTPVNDQLKKVADFWNTGYDTTSLPTNPDLLVVSGSYQVSGITEGQSVTLSANKNYTGSHKAKLDQIIIRQIADPQSAVQALQNGDVDVIAPQASADTYKSLDALTGVKVLKGDELAYDHLDLNFSGVFADPKVREAFMEVVPRQAILDAIITPMDSSAKVLDSQIFVPSQDGYADSVANNGSSAFAQQDIAGAKALLAGKHPTVKLLYNNQNPNRVDSFTLISKAATEAGFKIVDEGDPKWSTRLGDGSYDAVIFGWINPGAGVSGVPQIFGTGQASNFNGFSDKQADDLMAQLVTTTDTATQVKLQQQIDARIWASYYGLPLFQTKGVFGVADRVQGIDKWNPNQYGAFWNVWDWSASS